MNINRKELKKITYDFNSVSNRLLRAEHNDCDDVLKKFLTFIENNDLIFDYINDCGKPTYDVASKVNRVYSSHGNYTFELGSTDAEEVANIYHLIKYCVENKKKIAFLGMAYTSSNNFNDMFKCFCDRVIMVLIRHIEGYLTKIGIDMGMDENIKYSITVNDGQVNLAMDNATIYATQNNGVDIATLKKLIDDIKSDMSDNLSETEKEDINDSLETIENEMSKSQPKKGLVRTALTVLKNIKDVVGVGVSIADSISNLINFVQSFI